MDVNDDLATELILTLGYGLTSPEKFDVSTYYYLSSELSRRH